MRRCLVILISFFALLLSLSASNAFAAEQRIVGGTPAAEGSWPSIAVVYLKFEGDTYICGGSVVHRRWIMTAAHCVDGARNFSVVLGSNNRNAPTVPVSKAHVYQGYDAWTAAGDIALLKLSEATTQPAVTIAKPDQADLFAAGKDAYIAGWGTTCYDDPACPVQTMLREAEVNISDLDLCRASYEELGYLFPSKTVCADAPGRDSCQGDSGGPLMVDNEPGVEPARLQVGIVSFGEGCAEPDYPGVYTDATLYRGWLGSHIVYLTAKDRESWGKVKRKKNVARNISFQNNYGFPVRPNAAKITGSSRFQVRKNTCLRTLNTGDSCYVRVLFRATKKGKKQAKLIVKNNAHNLKRVSLVAVGK